jgi:hypothetical protein
LDSWNFGNHYLPLGGRSGIGAAGPDKAAS